MSNSELTEMFEALFKELNATEIERKGKVGNLYMLKAYFTYGHSHWLGFIASIGTFFLVSFVFIQTNWAFFATTFGIGAYLLIVGPLYFVVAVLIGRWDYKRGPYKTRAAMEWKENPVVKQMFMLLFQILSDIQELRETFAMFKDMDDDCGSAQIEDDDNE